jgi:reverse transcriptase-like protein
MRSTSNPSDTRARYGPEPLLTANEANIYVQRVTASARLKRKLSSEPMMRFVLRGPGNRRKSRTQYAFSDSSLFVNDRMLSHGAGCNERHCAAFLCALFYCQRPLDPWMPPAMVGKRTCGGERMGPFFAGFQYQARMQQKKWNKVKALQHLLTHSASGKLLAVRRVTVNDGRKTPGVDGELWDTPHKKLQGVISLTTRGYRPASPADLHPEGQREAPTVRNPNDAGSSHASLVSAVARSGRGNHCGSEFLRLSAGEKLCGRD